MKHRLKCGHTIFHQRCKECLSLEAIYYQKLKTSDFEDIEDVNHPERLLKSWHSFKFTTQDPLKRSAPEEYYHAAADLLHTYSFEKPIHRYIWELHCQGKSKREIEAMVAVSGFKKKLKREMILNIIRKIAKEIIR